MLKKTSVAFVFFWLVFLCAPLLCAAGQLLVSPFVRQAPVLDGVAEEPVWGSAQAIVTKDGIANIPLTIKSVHTHDWLFFLVQFPDSDESRSHKSWSWVPGREIYKVGNDIEDIFVFKWSLSNRPIDLSIYADRPSRADVWFWKACRTDPIGYADDKMHILSSVKIKDAIKLRSRSGTAMYLLRKEDAGRSAYRTKMPVDYVGDLVPRYENQQPSGSRADIQAKGYWQNGAWTIELGRKMITGNEDDVQFEKKGRYLFGVSRFEVAGRGKNPKLSQPLYGAGDTGEALTLVFAGK